MSVAIFKSTVPGPLSWIPQDFVQCSNPLNMADRDMTWTELRALFGDHLDTDHIPLSYDFEVIRVCGLNDSMTGCLNNHKTNPNNLFEQKHNLGYAIAKKSLCRWSQDISV